MIRLARLPAFALAAMSVLLAAPALGQTFTERVASGLSSLLYGTSTPCRPNDLFVLEQGSGGTARIKILALDSGTVTTFLTVTGLVTTQERGLLGLAFHPEYASNGLFYVYVSIPGGTNHQSQIRRYQAMGDPCTATSADPASLSILMRFNQPFVNQNGGWIAFGGDGRGADGPYLYIASGDGGSGGDPQNNSQDITNNRLGKILRIDVDGDDFPADPNRDYAIPPDNPFVGITGDDEIWAYGLRNPWRNSFDRANGDLWIGDVGQNLREEINHQPADSPGGENYGWRVMEANSCFDNSQAGGNPPCFDPSLTAPVYDYTHGFGSFQGFSVTGGYVYRGSVARYEGHYFFADFISENIWSLDPLAVNPTASVVTRGPELPPDVSSYSGISSFAEDALGEVYIVSYSNGSAFRIDTTSRQAVWNGDDAVGDTGDGSSWNDADNWTRGEDVDVGFVSHDEVIFATGSSVDTIDMQGDRQVAGVRFDDSFTLTGGALTVLSGNIRVAAGITTTIDANLLAEVAMASIRKRDAGRLDITGSVGQTIVLDGTLGGTGVVADLRAPRGTVAPGADGTAVAGPAAGVLSVAQDYVQQDEAMLQIEIGGTTPGSGHDQLDVAATASLDGTLTLSYLEGFVASEGDEFTVIVAGTVEGQFDQLDRPDGQDWEIEYDRTQVIVRVLADLCPADIDDDGMVNVFELLALLSSWGQSGVPEDINDDGLVDVLDLLAVLSAWGPCS